MITTAESRHGPEITHLKDGVTGLIVRGSVVNCSDAVIVLFNDPAKLNALKNAALHDSVHYTLDNMVSRFTDAIEHCVAMDGKR